MIFPLLSVILWIRKEAGFSSIIYHLETHSFPISWVKVLYSNYWCLSISQVNLGWNLCTYVNHLLGACAMNWEWANEHGGSCWTYAASGTQDPHTCVLGLQARVGVGCPTCSPSSCCPSRIGLPPHYNGNRWVRLGPRGRLDLKIDGELARWRNSRMSF